MSDVVFHKKAERDRLIIANRDAVVHFLFRDVRDDVRKVKVVAPLERHQICPRLLLVVLGLYPSFLFIFWK